MKTQKTVAALIAAQMLMSAMPAISFASGNDVTIPYNFAADYTFPKDTPAENVFYVEGQPFIMLDSASAQDASFFLYADKIVANACYYGTQKFVPYDSDGGRLCTLLNNGYINGTWGDIKFPQTFKNYLDTDHEWVTEAGAANGGAAEEYTFSAPVTLLSLTELKEYSAKIGYGVGHYVYLRTGDKDNASKMLNTNTHGYVESTPIANLGDVRPCFWIGEDFFRENKLDVSKMGSNVKGELLDRYQKSELAAAGYSETELEEIGYSDNIEAEINGILKPGYTLTARHTKHGTYQWYRCDSAADDGVAINGATSERYTLKNADGGKYLKFVVTKSSSAAETIVSGKIAAPLDHKFTFGEVNKYWQPAVTPAENVFYVDGRKFIFLDTDGETSYIYADEKYVNYPMYASQKFIPNNEADRGIVSTWMQTNLISTGSNAIKIPQSLTEKIDYNHVWLTEGGAADGPCPDDYTFTAGLSFLSLSELRQYASKIGYTAADYRIMRSGSTISRDCMICTCIDGVIRHIGISDGNTSIVPAFYIFNDFFKTTKLDLDTTGEAVWSAIRNMYSEEEMSAIYSKSELKMIGYGKKATLEGTLKPGYTVTAATLKTGDSYRWYRCDTPDGEGTLIDGVSANTYTLKNADGGKYLKIEVVKNGDVTETMVSDKIDNALINDITSDTNFNISRQNPEENLFVLESDEQAQPFILLDSADDAKSSFFIYTSDIVWEQPWYGSQKFNPTSNDGGIVSVILNKGYLDGTVGKDGMKLPADFKTYIDPEHEWLTEGGASDGACPNDYVTKAGVSALSLTELRKYLGKFGTGSNYYTYLRTPATNDKMKLLKTDTNGYVGTHWINNGGGVRPCFWIGEDFFRNVRLDLLKTGENVKKAICARYPMSEMSKIYDEDELAVLGYSTTDCSIYNLKFTDENNKEIAEVRYAGNTLNVSATVASYMTETPVSMIVAVYNDKGDMIAANLDSKQLEKGQETPMSVSVDLSDFNLQKGYTASVYFWQDLNSMRPIGESKSL